MIKFDYVTVVRATEKSAGFCFFSTVLRKELIGLGDLKKALRGYRGSYLIKEPTDKKVAGLE